MCGISGWLNLKRQIDFFVFERMNNIAKHRGPDDEGYVSINGEMTPLCGEDTFDSSEQENIHKYKKKDFLVLGHRRLSIIDLSPAGHQPMKNTEETLCITFNGEIYNYIELKRELEQLGYVFSTHSDTEVLLYSYSQWGEDCVSHLNGMWAFAIWDDKNNKLFCSRDRLGAKPFHYYKDNENFLFSSELKQLCMNPQIPRRLNEEILTTQIMWGITDFSRETLIKDIYVLPGGCNLSITLNEDRTCFHNFSIKPYWDVTIPDAKTEDSAGVFETLRDAIQIRTRSDVPIGALLSGGLDSSCLVAEISAFFKEQGKDSTLLNTYTSCYEGFKEGDEREYAEAVNQYCHTTQNFIYPDEKNTFSIFQKMVWHMEGNCAFSSLGSFMTLREVAKKGEKVLINGQGSDETMFGYERYYAFYFKDLIKKGKIKKLIHEYRKAVNNSALSFKMLMQYFVYFTFPGVRKTRCKKRMEKYVSTSVKTQFKKNKKVYPYLFFDSLDKLQYNELRGTQLTHILRMDDRGYMAYSMESRVPYIDYRYVEGAVRIRPEQKIEHGYTKYLLRKFIEGRLPDSVVWRKNKMGWPSPKERWVKRFDQKEAEALFQNSRSKKYFKIDALKRLYATDPASYPVEQFFIVETFMRLFDVTAAE